jgi:Galactose oxidase, central domain
MSVSHPENFKICHRLKDSDHDVSGSTSCCIEDIAYIIGGFDSNQIGKKSYLQVDCLDLLSKLWIPTYLNSNGILNRSYHCSCVINKDIYLFGGCTTGNESCNQNSDEVIRIHKTVFGLVSTIHSVDNSVSCQGQSVSIMGKFKSYVLLYGGMTFAKDNSDQFAASAVFRSNLSTFSYIHSEASFCPVEVAPEDEVPTGRAFHTAVVCGDDSEYLIICGGRNGEMCLNDIWLLDMTSILLTLDSADSSTKEKRTTDSSKDKKPASTKRKGTHPTARWSKVKIHGEIPFLPRQLHCSYFIPCSENGPSSSSNGHIYFFGGLSESGLLRCTVEEYEISISDKIVVMTLIEESSPESDVLNDSICGFGSSTSLFFGASNVSCSSPKALLIFGGNHQVNGARYPSYSKCILFEESNNRLMKVINFSGAVLTLVTYRIVLMHTFVCTSFNEGIRFYSVGPENHYRLP